MQDRGGIGRFGAHPLACLADRDLHEVAAGEVGGLERIGVGGSLDRVLGEQQLGGLERLALPPGSVEPRRDDERDGLEVHGRGHDPGAVEECRDPGSRRGLEADQPEPRDRPVLPDDGRHVGHAADRREVREVQGEGGTAGHLSEEQLGDLERDAAAGQPAVGVRGIGAVRVDEGQRRRQDRGDAVMVGDDDVEPARDRGRDLDDAGRTAIHGDDDRRAGRLRRVERRHATVRGPRRAGSGHRARPPRRTGAGPGS